VEPGRRKEDERMVSVKRSKVGFLSPRHMYEPKKKKSFINGPDKKRRNAGKKLGWKWNSVQKIYFGNSNPKNIG
jgi:hypothetical protein